MCMCRRLWNMLGQQVMPTFKNTKDNYENGKIIQAKMVEISCDDE